MKRYAKPSILASIPHDRHTVIEASAGTGKTYTLEHLVVDLVLAADVPIEKLLVVTYTERAAAELRMRLRAKLRSLYEGTADDGADGADRGAGHWTIDADAKAKLHAALTSFDLASISTIHAFCQEMLRDNAFASRRLFEQKLVDGRVAFSRAFLTALRRTLARDVRLVDYLEAWLGAGRDLDELRTLLYECHQHRGVIRPPWSEDTLAEAVARVAAAKVSLPLFELALKQAKVHANTARAAAARYRRLLGALGSPDTPRGVAFLAANVAALHDDDTFQFLTEKIDRTKIFHPDVRSMLEAIPALAAAVPPFHSVIAQRFLPIVTAELVREKSRTGQLDFDDMLSMLWSSLEGPEGDALARSIRARYSHALVDEFQDTDDVQWKIFRRIFVEGRGRNVLYVVGDPKQAIYAFRGADVFTYLAAIDELASARGARTTLTESYRSTPRFVEALNLVLDQSAAAPFFDGRIRYDHPVTAARGEAAGDLPGPAVRLVSITPAEGQRVGPALAKATFGPWMAAEIRRLVDGADGAPVDPKDIFVLARTGGECLDAGRHLRALGIPHAFYKQEGLFQTDEARDILVLLTAIADPERRSRRFRTWMGPFFAVPIEALESCIDLPAVHPLMARLFAWHELAEARDYVRLFNGILEESGIVERELFFDDSERRLTNYLHIFEILLEEASRTRPTIEELVHTLTAFVEKRRLPEGENGNVQRLESERSAVQVMTMHKAKGLEARVVFIHGSFAQLREQGRVFVYHDRDERCLAVGEMGDARRIIETEATEEAERLLYVALTRAKERVYLTHFPSVVTTSKSGEQKRRRSTDVESAYGRMLDVIDPLLARASGEHADPRLASLFSVEVLAAAHDEDAAAPPALPPEVSAWSPPSRLLADVAPSPELRQLGARRFGLSITSYSKIKAARGGHHPPVSVLSEDDVALDAGLAAEAVPSPLAALAGAVPLEEIAPGARVRMPTDLPGGSASGKFLHEVLEKVPFETIRESGALEFWCARSDVREVFRVALENHDRDRRHLRHSMELVHTALSAPIDLGRTKLDGGFAASKQIVRELEFLYPSVEHELIKGYIDLVFEHEGRIYLLDWKSDLLPSYRADDLKVHTDQNYALQAELYALALVKMLGIDARERYEELFGGTVYCYVRGMTPKRYSEGVLYFRPSWREIQASERRLVSGALAGAPVVGREHEEGPR
ncbi:UvrD-helicase domain-containing protein [Myxococcota bacterium]|nr:UvrD-helicase domain-containing protein [Myxococcota bacterium]